MSSLSAPLDPGLLAEKLWMDVRGRLKMGFASRQTRVGLRRDLRDPWTVPKAKIPIAVSPLSDRDRTAMLDLARASDRHDWLERAWRRSFARKHPQGGYVAIDLRDGTPCYMQWLLTSADNGFIDRLGGFPLLKQDEALLENAYTAVTHRGLGIMSAAMAMIAEQAGPLGARYVSTFVDDRNLSSLKGCERAGFRPYLLHRHRQVGFQIYSRDSFEPLPVQSGMAAVA